MTMTLAHRPKRPGFAMEAWDVLNTMENPWMTPEEIYNLLPDAVRRKHHGLKKLKNALQNGVERGLFVFIGESHGNRSDKKYRIATEDHRKQMMRKYRAAMAQWPSKKAEKEAKAKHAKKLNGSSERNDLVRKIDSEIEKVESRLAVLNRMRKDALTL